MTSQIDVKNRTPESQLAPLEQPLAQIAPCPMLIESPLALTRVPAEPQAVQAQEVVAALCRTIADLTARVQQMERQQGVDVRAEPCPCPARENGGMCPLVDPKTGYYTGPVANLLP